MHVRGALGTLIIEPHERAAALALRCLQPRMHLLKLSMRIGSLRLQGLHSCSKLRFCKQIVRCSDSTHFSYNNSKHQNPKVVIFPEFLRRSVSRSRIHEKIPGSVQIQELGSNIGKLRTPVATLLISCP